MAMAHGDDARAVQAAALALEETDHTRLPSWMVARMAVLTASREWRNEYEDRVVRPLREENERLRAEVEGLRAHLGIATVRPRQRRSSE